MFLACVGMSWVGVKMQRARKQKEVVEEIKKLGGFVYYDYQVDSWGDEIAGAEPPGPAWMRSLLGDDFSVAVIGAGLHGTEASDADLEQLKGFTQPRWLWLGATQVTGDGLKHLKGLTQIQQLWLSNTQLTDAGLKYLKGLTQLQQLPLDGTQVTDAGLENLKGLTQLQTLFLQGTQVTDEGVKELQQVLPNCQIFH